jgi:putative glutamine amidotransferase
MLMKHYKIANAWYPDKLPFSNLTNSKTVVKQGELRKDNILVLWGGEDIGTEIYNQVPNKYVHIWKMSERDREEITLTKEAIALGIPILGICRGAQLLCCLTGGWLVQHIENHVTNKHSVICENEPSKFFTNSCHHQMMVPNADQKVLAYAPETRGVVEADNNIRIERVPEVVHFPKIRALGIQGHPEWPSMPKPFNDYCEQLISDLLL